MKDQFIEKDGMLFMKCKPEPMKKDTPMPCIAELIYDSSPMGIYNKARSSVQVSGMATGINKQYPQFEYLDWEHNEYMHWSRYNIVAKHCPEGSVEWALWQMLNGNMVTQNSKIWGTNKFKVCDNDVYYYGLSGSWITLYPIVEWLTNAARIGWQIYEELIPTPMFEVGKCYKHVDYHEYLLCEQVFENRVKFRKCGTLDYVSFGKAFYGGFALSPIEPDFSDARTGDECFSVFCGVSHIADIGSSSPITVHNDGALQERTYSLCGRNYLNSKHPTLFHTAAQCAAYFAEVALKESEK